MRFPSLLCVLVALIGIAALSTGCGDVEELVEVESGKEFAERNTPVPEDSEVEGTLNAFLDSIYAGRPAAACRHLTSRGFRELVDATIVEGEIEATYEECPEILARLTKGGLRSRRHFEVTGVSKEEYEGRYYLVVDVDRGPGLMTSDGKRIASFNGPE